MKNNTDPEAAETVQATQPKAVAPSAHCYTDSEISEIVERLLCWKLPEDFRPDAGISFEPEYNAEYMASLGKSPMRHEPAGTNLFGTTQAEAMIRHILGCNSGLCRPDSE